MALGRGFGSGGAGTPGANGNTIAQFEFVTSTRPSYQAAGGFRYVPLVVDSDEKQEMQCVAPATGTAYVVVVYYMSAANSGNVELFLDRRVIAQSANDPDAVDSYKLAITCTRADQDFDINEIQLVGNLATRTVNFGTRSGLNANVDIPKQSGVYFVAKSFNSASSSYTLDVYFNKSVVGSTITSAYIKDCNGVTLWSV